MLTLKHLPVYQNRQHILEALKKHQVIVVESPTGSGKTTQIPLILDEAGYTSEQMIGITQPRRIAATSVAAFMQDQLQDYSNYVAYKMRFSDTSDSNTKIKVMTDGTLLMELKSDPLLSNYSVMMVDEAHERSLNIDFVLGLLKNILAVRTDFRVIISSATINTKAFSAFFDSAPIVSIEARVHPVDISYHPLAKSGDLDELISSITALVEEHVRKYQGDILVFLPGEFEIKSCMQALLASRARRKLLVRTLYSRLSKEEQEKVFLPTPDGKIKVVVATNIAETSVTIDGITSVIDSGIAKINYYNQRNFTSALITMPISRSSCEQRAGRAGRTQAGRAFRLYSEEDFTSRPQYETEEILRTDLSEVVLRMSELGILEYEKFPFVTRPKNRALKSAEETLHFIEAIDEQRNLTAIGKLMSKFPLLPRHARVLVESLSRFPTVINEVIIAVAFLSSRSPFYLPAGEENAARNAHQRFASDGGDFLTYLEIFNQFTAYATAAEREKFCQRSYLDYPSMVEIFHVAEQISDIVSQEGFVLSEGGSVKEYLICLASGLLQYVCVKTKRSVYQSLTATQIYIHPGSAWFKELPQFILAGEIVQTSRMFARSVSPLKREWLDEISPGLRNRLLEMRRGGAKESTPRSRRPAKDEAAAKNEMTIYGKSYPLERRGKKKQEVTIIPAHELASIAKKSATSARRPRNFPAALRYNGYYIHYGDKFYSLLELAGNLDLQKGIVPLPHNGVISLDELSTLTRSVDQLLALSRLKKGKDQLGFIALDYYGKGLSRFTVKKNFFDALDLSLYALSHLIEQVEDYSDQKSVAILKKRFTHLVKTFER